MLWSQPPFSALSEGDCVAFMTCSLPSDAVAFGLPLNDFGCGPRLGYFFCFQKIVCSECLDAQLSLHRICRRGR
jgi:hypothetical protein